VMCQATEATRAAVLETAENGIANPNRGPLSAAAALAGVVQSCVSMAQLPQGGDASRGLVRLIG
jgi:hypothetical protein